MEWGLLKNPRTRAGDSHAGIRVCSNSGPHGGVRFGFNLGYLLGVVGCNRHELQLAEWGLRKNPRILVENGSTGLIPIAAE